MVMMSPFGRMVNDPSYKKIIDYVWYTRILIECGYRLFQITWRSGREQEVWMKASQAEQFESVGEKVVPKHMGVVDATVILVDPLDGGYINEYGRVVGFQ